MSMQQEVHVQENQGPAVGTIVWGAVIMVVGALMLANRLGWLTVEPAFAAAGILLLAGLGLVIGGLAASARGRRAAVAAGRPDAPSATDDGAGSPGGEGSPSSAERGPADRTGTTPRSPYVDPYDPNTTKTQE